MLKKLLCDKKTSLDDDVWAKNGFGVKYTLSILETNDS